MDQVIQVIAEQLQSAWRKLGWSDTSHELAIAIDADLKDRVRRMDQCLLRCLIQRHASQSPILTSVGVAAVSRLVANGISLRTCWPRGWSQSVDGWLGQRLYLSHASIFSPAKRLTSIVSSRIGRHGRLLPEWPDLLNSILRGIYRNRDTLLIAPGTTLSESLQQYSDAAGMPSLLVECSTNSDAATWLAKRLATLSTDTEAVTAGRNRLDLSPAITVVDRAWASMPLQDRLSIALSDSIHALAVRPRGTIERLLGARLRDACFPTASVYVALGGRHHDRSAAAPGGWMDHGAVGWLVTPGDWEFGERQSWLTSCHQPTGGVATQQLCSPLPASWTRLQASDDWPYLVHCTRRAAGPLPDECRQRYRSRIWLEGTAVERPPLETLARICRERLLRGSSTITRTTARCVSLSAVPLIPLLKRRTFRSQLGRWDWEPYGLLIDRQALSALGAKPVIYGVEADYAQLAEAQRAFFQPFGKGHRSSGEDWSAEREWRVIGDLDLNRLPNSGVCVFVKHRSEALQLARQCRWPVMWIDG